MLNGISTILTGDMLKVLCDMGHGDELVIADANFPADTYAKRLVRCSGINGAQLLEAILPLLPLDSYTDDQAVVMDLTDGDKVRGCQHRKCGRIIAVLLLKTVNFSRN